jgi:hypothetical protein
MTAEQVPRPGIRRAPEWVGEGDDQCDVSHMSDRKLAAEAFAGVLRVNTTLQHHSNEFREFRKDYDESMMKLLRELPEYSRRLAALEAPRLQRPPTPGFAIPPPAADGPRAELPSSHEWDEMLAKAGQELSRRVKDPRDRLSSDRAREIAKEVIESTKTADDAKSFRTWKSKGQKIAWGAVKALVAAAIGAAAAHYGLH